MINEIHGKVVTITGASSGMGKAIAIALAKNGAKVVLGARRKEHLQQLVEEIKNHSGEAVFTVTDVRKRNVQLNTTEN